MQMINEITIMQQNKNIFNKILSSLNRNKIAKEPYLFNTYNAFITFSVYGTYAVAFSYIVNVNLKLRDIIMVTEKDNVYFCVKVSPELSKVCYMGESSDDLAMTTIKYVLKNKDGYYTSKLKEDLLESEGITSSSSNDDIKNSKIYKELSKKIEDVYNVEYKFKLEKSVQKKLKVRDNIMPLIIYSKKDDDFDYAVDRLRGKPINSTSCREKEFTRNLYSKEGLVDKMCRYAVYYAPYSHWCKLVPVKYENYLTVT